MPAPIRIEVRGIADTSNFDDFGDCDLTIRKFLNFFFEFYKFSGCW